MDDLISRQAAIDALDKEYRYGADIDRCGLSTALDYIEDIPAADVAPVVHGRWKKKKDSDLFYCSECELPSMHKWPYCKRCGAKMDGERKE